MPEMGEESGTIKELLENETYGLSALEALVDDLESRITALRAGYLDNLSGGAVALASVCTEARLAKLDWSGLAFKYQEAKIVNQENPTQNEYIELIDETGGIRVYQMAVLVEDTNETLQLNIEADGETIAGVPTVCTAGAAYNALLYPDPINNLSRVRLSTGAAELRKGFILEGHEVKIEVRKTTDDGNGDINGVIQWGKMTGIS